MATGVTEVEALLSATVNAVIVDRVFGILSGQAVANATFSRDQQASFRLTSTAMEVAKSCSYVTRPLCHFC